MTKKPPKNKRNEAYWQSREQAEKDYMINNLKSDDAFNQVLQTRYNHTANELSDKITAELSRLSDKNVLSYAEAQKAVRSADMKRLGNEAKLIVQKARATGNKELTKEVADRLRLYNATMRINRLEMLKAKIGQEMTDLGIDLTQDLQKRLSNDYQAEVKRQAGLMSNSVAPANSVATTAVLKHVYGQTGGANFSNRVWHNMDVLKSRLDMELSNVVMTGKNIQDVAKELRPLVNKHVNNVRYATERIARTESARIQNEAKLDALKRNGYKFCKWHAEPKACPECAQIARQDNGWGAGIYKVSDVPYLPAHPNCRCSLSAYWVDDEKVIENVKYGHANFTVANDKQNEILKKITPDKIQSAVDYIVNTEFDNSKLSKFNTKQITAALNKAHEIGFDKKPLIVKNDKGLILDKSKIYRYTDRKRQLINGELEYSSEGKSFHGRGIYFGNAESNITGYNRDESHELVTATLIDDTILVDKEKVSEIVINSGIDIRKAGIGALSNNTRQAVWSMVAMDVGIDGFINQDLGYVVLFNRGKLVILDD